MYLGGLMLPAALVLLLLYLIYRYGTRTHGTLERLGIPVVPPVPFLGSTPQPWNTFTHVEDARNAARYGRVWGAYEGPTPQIFINDAELAKRIFIKDFDHFVDRPNIMDFELGRDMLDFLTGDRWKAVRSVLSPPMASAAKLKAMMPVLQQCTEDACRRLDEKISKSPNVSLIKDLYGTIVLDVMAQFSFGMKFDDIGNPENPLVKHVSTFSGQPEMTESKIAGFMTFSPWLMNYVLGRLLTPLLNYCTSLVRSSMKQRRAEGIERADLVNILMETIDNKVPTKEFRDLNITEDLLTLQGAEMLMAAYDTTGLTLTNTTYYLVKNPDVMARLIDEIDAAGDELTYESLHQMPLMDAVLHESQRLSPLVRRHIRLCGKDWEADGLRIPAGMQVIIPVTPYHMNPEAFPDPERFDPDRWLGDKGLSVGKDYYMPFGIGPRACIGQRLAMVECKFVLAYILKHYKLSANANTKMVRCKGVSVMGPTYPIQIDMEKLE